MKKIISIVLVILMAVNIFAVSAFALNDTVISADDNIEYHKTPVELLIKSDIFEQLNNRISVIDISEYSLSENEAEKLFYEVYDENAFVLNAEITPEFIEESGYIKQINVEYEELNISLFSTDEITDEVNRILACIDDSMTDVEKALVVNDYFSVNYCYDLTYSVYTKEELFAGKTGVCAAYARAYQYIMSDMLNIPCLYITSDEMNHAWNLLYIDDEWYHVDTTWNDPVPDMPGVAMHNYFLLSDIAISDEAHEHKAWNSPYPATDTKYDNYFWSDIDIPIIIEDGYYYYLTSGDGKIHKRDVETDTDETIYTITSIWPCWDKPGYYWMDKYSQIIYRDGLLYVNTPSEILSMNLNGENVKTIMEYNTSEGYIWGLMADGDKIKYFVSRDFWEYGIESYKTFTFIKNMICSGKIKAFDSVLNNIRIEILKDGEVVDTKFVTNEYSFEDVAEGTYTLKVSKSKHATREYQITVSGNTTQNVEIWLYGDVTKDGLVNNADTIQINRKNANLTSVFSQVTDSDYRIKVANVTAIAGVDSIINNADVIQINRKNANLNSVFDRIA